MPFPSITGFAAVVDLTAGDLAIKGDIEVDAFDNLARFTGLSSGIFSNMPANTFFGNLYTVDGPGRAFPASTVAGPGLAYTTDITNGPFPEIVFEGAQSFIVTGTTHTVELPDNILPGHRIILGTYHNQAAQSVTTPSGFTLLGKVETTDGEINVYERIYDGSANDPQAELDITSSVTSSLLVYIWHLRFCHASFASEVTTQLANNASDTSNDLGNLAPTWAASSVKTLYLTFIGIEADVAAPNITAFPSSFEGTGQLQIVSGTASLDGAIGWGHRFLGATSLNPGAYTYGPARSGAFLIAVPPAVAGRLEVGASTSIIATSDTVERAALTGAIAAAQNSNATLFSGIRVNGAATTDRTNINFIAGSGVTLTPTDDAGNDEIEITIVASGGAGSQGWDDTLAIDNHTGNNNPFIDTANHINFGTTAASEVTGQIRSQPHFHIHVDQSMDIQAHDLIHVFTPDAITIESTSGSTVQMLSSSIVRISSSSSDAEVLAADNVTITAGLVVDLDGNDIDMDAVDAVDINGGGDVNLGSANGDIIGSTPNGSIHWMTGAGGMVNLDGGTHVYISPFLKMPEQASSTESVGAGDGMFWVRNLVPSRPYFTDDTNVDFQIALLPIALTDIATIADDTFLGNISGGAASPSAITFSSFAGDGLTYDATNHHFDVVGSTSIVITSDTVTRAALTGAIAASANSNATLFAGIRDNGAAETDRTNLNFVNGTNTTIAVTDDAGNDELEIAVSVDNFPLSGLADQAAETFVGNFTAGSAPPTARAGTSVAGGGLTYAAGGTLAVGAGTYITVNADDVAVNRTALSADLDSTSVVNNAGVLERAALTGAIAASQNSNATLFAGIRDNGSAETDRTNLNFVNGLNTTIAVTDDAANDELEIAVSVDNFPLSGLADQADDTFVANTSGVSGPPSAKTFASLAGDGLTYDATNHQLDVVGSTSIVVTSDTVTRAALTGAIAASANSNATLFAGIRDNGSAETDRTNLNFVNGTNTTIAVTDDAGNDELEIAVSVDNFPLSGLADQAANTVVANATAGTAAPTALAMGTHTLLARIAGNIVAHPFNTLAGEGIDYDNSAGVMSAVTASSFDTFIGSVPNAIGFRKSNSRCIWWEDFDYITATGTAGVVEGGQTNWGLLLTGTGGVSAVAPVTGHPGIVRLQTSVAINDSTQLMRGTSNTQFDSIRGNQIYEIEAVINIPTVTTLLWEFGWRNSTSTNYLEFYGDTNVGTNIRVFSEEGNVSTGTDTDTGVAMTAGAWNVYTIRQESLGEVDYYIDDVLEATHNTNIPDAEDGFIFFRVLTRVANSREIQIDYVHFESQLLTRTS